MIIGKLNYNRRIKKNTTIMNFKKIFFGTIFSLLVIGVNAQRFAYVDTEYILEQMPEYGAAQKQIDVLSEQWADEIHKMRAEVDKLYRQLQVEEVLLTAEMIEEKKVVIKKKETEVSTLQQKRFGYQGDLFKKQQELIKPVQDKVYQAIQTVARNRSYDFILDRAAGEGLSILFVNPKYDKSDDVLKEMGYVPKKKSSSEPNRKG